MWFGINQTGNGYFWADVPMFVMQTGIIKVFLEMFWGIITAIMDSRL